MRAPECRRWCGFLLSSVGKFLTADAGRYKLLENRFASLASVGLPKNALENTAFRVKIYNVFYDLANDRGGNFSFNSEASCPRATRLEAALCCPRALLVNLRQMEILQA